MAVPQTESILKSYFETGKKPTEAQFAEWIETMFYYITDLYAQIETATDDAAAALARAPLALLKATTNGVSAYTIEAGDLNIASVAVTDPLTLSEIIKVTWDTPFATDDYKVLICAYSGLSPRRNQCQIVTQTTDYVELKFSTENLSSYGLPSFHLCVFL